MIPLNDQDRTRVTDVEARIAEAGKQLGYLREEFLNREAALVGALTSLRTERRQLLASLGREYLSNEDPNQWQYNADTKTFEPKE